MATLPLHTGALPRGELLGRYRTYEDAQKVVDHLAADEDFDVKMLTIVGNDLRSVEKVRGRLSYPRVAGTGALQGALFGAFMGLLLMLFTPEAPLLNLGMAVLMGMAIWMIIGVVSFAARRGTRGFVSASQLTATTYDVVCDFQVAVKARQLVPGAGVTSLNAMNDPTGQPPAGPAPASAGPAQRQFQQNPPQGHQSQPAQHQPQAQNQSHSQPQAQDHYQARRPQQDGGQVHPENQQVTPAPSENAASQGASATADHDERTRATQEWQEPGGKPRYGVRLSDVDKPDSEGSPDKSAQDEPEQTTAPHQDNTHS